MPRALEPDWHSVPTAINRAEQPIRRSGSHPWEGLEVGVEIVQAS